MTHYVSAGKVVLIAASAATAGALGAITATRNDVLIELIRETPAIIGAVAGVAAMYFAYRAKSTASLVHTEVVEVKRSVNGMTQAAVQAATDVGVAQTAQAHAEGHLEGVVAEQSRKAGEDARTAAAAKSGIAADAAEVRAEAKKP
jgi:hypothetical protein